MNLRQGLLQHEKPIHQFHDRDSLQWMISHKPKFLPGCHPLPGEFIEAVRKNKPWDRMDNRWFANDLTRDGIHGFRHACRVSLLAMYLALEHHPLSEKELAAVMFSGLLHDCRRKNDNADPRHGARAALWLERNRNILPGRLQSLIPAIRFSISVHNDPYPRFSGAASYKKYKPFVDLLKTADALDRYRFPRADWWISKKFIVLPAHKKGMAFAFELAYRSESFFFKTADNKRAILSSWNELQK